ncbi:unnamed protein product, partial [Nesidiocoris tenuis]
MTTPHQNKFRNCSGTGGSSRNHSNCSTRNRLVRRAFARHSAGWLRGTQPPRRAPCGGTCGIQPLRDTISCVTDHRKIAADQDSIVESFLPIGSALPWTMA